MLIFSYSATQALLTITCFVTRSYCNRIQLLVTALYKRFSNSVQPNLRGVVKDKHSAVDSIVWRRWLVLEACLRVVRVVAVHEITIVGGGGQKEREVAAVAVIITQVKAICVGSGSLIGSWVVASVGDTALNHISIA